MVLVGTTKGAFFFYSDPARQNWQMTGPHLEGWEVASVLGDSRNGNRIFAGTNHYVYGTTIRLSEDFGETWTELEQGPSYSEESGHKLNRIWQITPGHPSEPSTYFAGVDEAGLFASRDSGQTWSEVTGLTAHHTRPNWFPGNGGLCLHTILVDPDNAQRMWIAISAVGVFRTEDGGKTWVTRNKGLPAVPTGGPESEINRCVHKMVLDPNDSDTLYQQFHGGVLKSTDGGDTWTPIETGLPGNFGFPMVMTPTGDLFIIPLAAEAMRAVKDGRLEVYRSQDRGATWAPVGTGLPESPHYVGVLRDAMTTDGLDPAGLYFGTTMGEVFYSPDAGETWNQLPGNFPRILMVKTWVLES